MTAEEALAGIREISRHFGQGYKWSELEPVWSALLLCAPQAMVRAVGVIKKHGKWRPDPDYLLARVQWWHMNMRQKIEAEEIAATGADPGAEGKEALQLLKDYTGGQTSIEEYARRLYALSTKYGKPGYAIEAQEKEERRGGKDCNGSVNDRGGNYEHNVG
ncbi:MAG TPA: hypothetical protein DCZ63_08610 [Geobacter sp.]|nr:hypothetical protein [Geobacter sp.]